MQQALGMTYAQKVDYLMVISPAVEIMRVANGLKREVGKIIGNYKSKSSIPHITICKSLLTTDRERRIFFEWEKLVTSHPKFKLTIKGLKVFESSGTLYLETSYSEELKELRKRFIFKNKELRISKQGYHLISTPHITIGRSLTKQNLDKLKQLISEFSFEAEFLVENLIVLRADSTDIKYQNAGIFKFQNLNTLV